MKAIFFLTLRALTGWKRPLVLGLLILVPALLGLVFSLSTTDEDGTRFAVELFDNLVLPVIMPIIAVIVAASALGHEVEDRTLIYLTLKPVSRFKIVIAKYASAVCIVAGLVEVGVAAMFVLASRKAAAVQPGLSQAVFDKGNTAGGLLIAALGGSAAYAGLFLLLGLLMPQRGLLVGFAYVLGWEGLAAGLSMALATLSVRRYVQGLLDTHLASDTLAQLIPSTLSAGGSVLGLLIVVAATVLLTTWRLTCIQLP